MKLMSYIAQLSQCPRTLPNARCTSPSCDTQRRVFQAVTNMHSYFNIALRKLLHEQHLLRNGYLNSLERYCLKSLITNSIQNFKDKMSITETDTKIKSKPFRNQVEMRFVKTLDTWDHLHNMTKLRINNGTGKKSMLQIMIRVLQNKICKTG